MHPIERTKKYFQITFLVRPIVWMLPFFLIEKFNSKLKSHTSVWSTSLSWKRFKVELKPSNLRTRLNLGLMFDPSITYLNLGLILFPSCFLFCHSFYLFKIILTLKILALSCAKHAVCKVNLFFFFTIQISCLNHEEMQNSLGTLLTLLFFFHALAHQRYDTFFLSFTGKSRF